MNYEDALRIIRKEKPNQFIHSCYEYDNKYIFTVSIDDKNIEEDLSLCDFSVDKATGEVKCFDYWKESLDNIFGNISTNLRKSKEETFRLVDAV